MDELFFTIIEASKYISASIDQAPGHLVSYRGRVGQTFQFTLTGTKSGSVWGTDIYTDDSTLACAAVHAGVVLSGETKVVTVTIRSGQSSYQGSVRNGVRSSSYGSWPGSYSFVGKYVKTVFYMYL